MKFKIPSWPLRLFFLRYFQQVLLWWVQKCDFILASFGALATAFYPHSPMVRLFWEQRWGGFWWGSNAKMQMPLSFLCKINQTWEMKGKGPQSFVLCLRLHLTISWWKITQGTNLSYTFSQVRCHPSTPVVLSRKKRRSDGWKREKLTIQKIVSAKCCHLCKYKQLPMAVRIQQGNSQ